MSTELDKLYYTLDADATPYNAALKQAESQSTATAKKIDSAWQTTMQSINNSTGVANAGFKSAADSAAYFSKAIGDTAQQQRDLAAIAKQTFSTDIPQALKSTNDGLQTLINQNVGVAASFKDAAASAAVFDNILGVTAQKQRELADLTRQQMAIGAGGGVEAAGIDFQQVINDTTGVSRSFTSAETSAAAFGEVLGDTQSKQKALAEYARTGVKDALDDMGNAFEASGNNASKMREALAEVHELLSGRWKNAISTATIELANFGVLGIAATVAAVAAIPVAFLAAAVSVENSTARIQRAIAAAGGAGGLTATQAQNLAGSVASPGMSYSSSLNVITALNSRGNVPAAYQGQVASAVPGYAAATNSTLSDAAAKLEQILADPAQGAAQLKDQFNALSQSQVQEVQELERQGESQRALGVVIDAITDRFKGLDEPTTALGRAWENLTTNVENIVTRIGNEGEKLANIATKGSASPQARASYLGDLQNRSPAETEELTNLQNQLLAKAVTDQLAASQAALNKQLDKTIANGQPLAEAYSGIVGQSEKFTDDTAALSSEIDALNQKLAKTPGDVQLLKDQAEATFALSSVALAAANQQTPATTAAQAAADARQVAAAPVNQRARLQATLGAQRQYQQNLGNPQTALYAGSILGSQLSTVGLSQQTSNKDTIQSTLDQADAQQKLADALEVSAAAGRDQQLVNQAHDAFLKGTITDENAYLAALRDESKAQLSATSADTIRNLEDQAASQERLTAALGQGAAAEQNQQNIEKTRAAVLSGATTDATAYLNALTRITDAERDANSVRQDRSLEEEVQERQLELSLLGQTDTAQQTELANLKTRNQLIDEGYQENTAAFNDELSKRTQLNAELVQTTQKTQQIKDAAEGVAQGFTTAFDTVIHGGSLNDALGQIVDGITQVIEKVFILIPLEKELQQLMEEISNTPAPGSGGSGGGFFGSILSSVGSFLGLGGSGGTAGASAAASDFADFAANGMAFGSKGERYLADGDVLGGTTRFNTASGPVVAGEKGPDSEALLPLARGPDGKLGVQSNGSGAGQIIQVVQNISFAPDIPSLVRQQIAAAAPQMAAYAVTAVKQTALRGG